MDLKKYAESVIKRWEEFVDTRIGWDIYDDTVFEMVHNTTNDYERADIYYDSIRWASIYYSDSEELDFETYTLNPIVLEEKLATDKAHLASLICQLASLIDASYISGLRCKTYTNYSN